MKFVNFNFTVISKNYLPVQVCFSKSGWKPALHLQPPVGSVHLPSPLHKYVGVPPTTSAFATQVPVACSIIVISLPVGVALKWAKLMVTSGHVM